MKSKFKNLFLLLLVAVYLILPVFRPCTCAISFSNIKLAMISSSNENTESDNNSEDSNVFEFIKNQDNVRDFFYDGSALLYGGILLIAISILGIFKTLKPKKNKRTKKRQINSSENIRR